MKNLYNYNNKKLHNSPYSLSYSRYSISHSLYVVASSLSLLNKRKYATSQDSSKFNEGKGKKIILKKFSPGHI